MAVVLVEPDIVPRRLRLLIFVQSELFVINLLLVNSLYKYLNLFAINLLFKYFVFCYVLSRFMYTTRICIDITTYHIVGDNKVC